MTAERLRHAAREPERPRPALTAPRQPRLDVLALQRSAGNAAVARLLARVSGTPVRQTGGPEIEANDEAIANRS